MADLIKKEIYSDYAISLNEHEMGLLIKGLELLKNSDSKSSYTFYLLQDLKEMQEKN